MIVLVNIYEELTINPSLKTSTYIILLTLQQLLYEVDVIIISSF